ncbi:hypothetical protein DL98DRAFT_281964 [Cadophora sp. DSE1049]|nr:hypothetical protein DL98DRAFT_281964 [Cadophora sp. DSE1049]
MIKPKQAIAYILKPVGIGLFGTVVTFFACLLNRIIYLSTVISCFRMYIKRFIS